MSGIHLIVKASNTCNMRCKYCYNSESGYGDETLPLEKFEKILRILAAAQNYICVVWHGGEPLVSGIAYYTAAMQIEERLAAETGVTIDNHVQTNATLIDDKWIAFFKKYNWKVGVSFDGVENAKYRQMTDEAMAGIRLLQKNKLPFAAMAVVSEGYDIQKNYDFFRERGIEFEFSPLFPEGGAEQMKVARTFAEDCNALFDRWIFDTEGVNVRMFYVYLSMALGGGFRICNYCSCLNKYLCIAPDGMLYNCSRHSVSAYPFANVDAVESLAEIYETEGFRALLKGSVERRRKCKEVCEWFSLCGGGCPDVAILENGLSEIPGASCETFRTIMPHVKEIIDRILAEKIPLEKLNPAVKRIFAQGCAVGDSAPALYGVPKTL